MKRLVFSKLAESDLLALTIYLAENAGADVAVRVAVELKERIRLLQHSPLMGVTTSRRKSMRQVIFDDYIVVYEVQANQVRIARIWRSKQNRPMRQKPTTTTP
jgi:plasmid stabilization system protein ParE